MQSCCMGEFWRDFIWYFEVHVWVNFGGIFSYNFVHCLFGLVPFNVFFFFFAMVFFFHDQSWKLWKKWLGIWKVSTIGEYSHFSVNQYTHS